MTPCHATRLGYNQVPLTLSPTGFFSFKTMPPAGKPDLSGYNYGAIASLVLTPDRSNLPRGDKEPDGAPTSLAGRIDPKQMGSRVQRQIPKDLDKKKKKATEGRDVSDRQPSKRRTAETSFGYTDIIEATQDVEGLTYRPRTAETREIYEMILSSVHTALGDQAQDVVRSAADTVLETLKNDSMKDYDKKKDVEEVLGSVTSDSFARLVNLSKKITDYAAEDEMQVDPDLERKDAEIDDELGVNVIIDEEEPEEEEDEGFEVREESDDEEEGAREEQPPADDITGGDELFFTGGSSSQSKSRAEVDKDIVSPHSIDAFWVQRQIAEIYPDPETAAEKTSKVMFVLGSESNLRDCENELMDIFEYDHFHVITKFLKNRDVVVWCTKLMRSDADERVNVEVAMREKGLGWILRELSGDRQAKARTDAMDVDEGAKQTVPKTANIAPGSTVQPKATVDLESMAFSQGGHLMSNKKCKLPEGSFKRAKKSYEEIHVPAPKQKPVVPGDLIPVDELPPWAREAFPGTKTLNRIQSKLYPVAFGTDEPILLCAPTGAGKVCQRLPLI